MTPETPESPGTPDRPSAGTPNFELALDQLQQTVKRLESGELSLEDSLKSFEEGVRLTRVCQQHLTTAEQRVDLLMKATAEGQIETQPFNPNRG